MRPTIQMSLPPMPVQKVSRTQETAAPDTGQALSHARESRLTDLLADAVSETCQEKEAAIAQGYEPPYWSRIKSGEKRAYLDPVGNLPEPTQRAFVRKWARQLRMRVSDEDAKQAAAVDLLESCARFIRESA